MRYFARQGRKRGQICALIQYYKSLFCVDNLIIIPEELIVKGNVYDIIEA